MNYQKKQTTNLEKLRENSQQLQKTESLNNSRLGQHNLSMLMKYDENAWVDTKTRHGRRWSG